MIRHETTRELLRMIHELYESGALLDCYGLDLGDEAGDEADHEELPPLERALRDWIDDGAPDAEEVTP